MFSSFTVHIVIHVKDQELSATMVQLQVKSICPWTNLEIHMYVYESEREREKD